MAAAEPGVPAWTPAIETTVAPHETSEAFDVAPPSEPQSTPANPWHSWVDTGLGVMRALVEAAEAPAHSGGDSQPSASAAAPFSATTRTNAATGQTFLQIALPPPDQLQRLLASVADMLATLAPKNKV